MKDEIKEILEKFNKEVEKAESARNPFSSEDKKIKHILVALSEEHFNIFKDILDYITNLQEKYERMKENATTLSNGYNELEQRNEKAIEYIQERYDYILKGDFLDHDEQVDKRQITYLLNILKGDNK